GLDPVLADRLQRAAGASAEIFPGGAGAADAEVAEGEVVADGVLGIEQAQAAGDVLRGLPGKILAPGQADEPADPVDVGIERHHQLGGGDLPPEPEIDSVWASHHPAQAQVEALAGAAAIGVRKQVLEPAGRTLLAGDRPEVGGAELVDERAERRADAL